MILETGEIVVAQTLFFPADGTYAGNLMGFIIMSDKKYTIGGDTALTLDMQLVPQGAPINVCIFPVGDNFTMGYEDAARVVLHLCAMQYSYWCHFNTFPYIEIDTVAKGSFQ